VLGTWMVLDGLVRSRWSFVVSRWLDAGWSNMRGVARGAARPGRVASVRWASFSYFSSAYRPVDRALSGPRLSVHIYRCTFSGNSGQRIGWRNQALFLAALRPKGECIEGRRIV